MMAAAKMLLCSEHCNKYGGNPVKKLLLAMIRFYQRHISPAHPRRCRYEPTCSEYAAQAIGKYGSLKGGALAARRLCRCHPFSKRDYFDPVP